MKCICAWCGTVLSDDKSKDARESHGICDACQTFLATNRPDRSLREFLETLPFPVLAVDSTAHVTVANTQAVNMLGKKAERIEGNLGGDAMECSYARMPGGCGKTDHCKTCTVRNSVMRTFESGTPLARIPAYQSLVTSRGVRRSRSLISTRRSGNIVLLKIEPGK